MIALSVAITSHAHLSWGISTDDIASMRGKLRERFPSVRTISAKELFERVRSPSHGLVIIDTRAKAEYNVSHIKDARLFEPDRDSLSLLTAAIARNAEIVTYCSVGYRSSLIAEKLMEEGYLNVSSLEGGIFEWANQGLPIFKLSTKGETPAIYVHPFDRKWGELLNSDLHPPLKAN